MVEAGDDKLSRMAADAVDAGDDTEIKIVIPTGNTIVYEALMEKVIQRYMEDPMREYISVEEEEDSILLHVRHFNPDMVRIYLKYIDKIPFKPTHKWIFRYDSDLCIMPRDTNGNCPLYDLLKEWGSPSSLLWAEAHEDEWNNVPMSDNDN